MTVTQRLSVDAERLGRRLDALAEVGATLDGVCRLALTDADRAGRDLVCGWMRDLGLRIEVDGVGNVVGTWPAERTDPPVMTGSHVDTVRTGGPLDGALGVLAGLEVIQTVAEAGIEPARPLAVAFFTDEEGSRFPPDMLGSLVYAGGLDLDDALDIVGIDGSTLGVELDRIGYRGPAACPGPPPAAFVELHIEQGPVLEAEGITIGAVTEVQGIVWLELVLVGQSNHAGTTPMHLRRDAGLVAGEVVVLARETARSTGGAQVATVGRIDLHPDLVNVVPGRASLTLDLRNTDAGTLAETEERIRAGAQELADREGVTLEWQTLARFEPVAFDPRIVSIVERAAVARDLSVRRIPSGAGHDAQMLARVCPAGMVFVPSVGGVSHNRAEHTDAADVGAGCNVLLDVMLELAGVSP